ncbi:TetR/AcrR family transcriptional regulator [Paludisphaera mucosa]|uniref:TetR/AcrR family transcriptional regulator n=1 Tax=Paludisphaera mucosa TaxID=3030827 RepID=A0ABT6FII7_9BACT|nr:TetR/AcrR family transcriptional regulator [Paludisphaera mucosa]MDG3007183.1 TetR/AcrR family transcriptional regulator [Paludisphaera mucosa]
MRYPADHKAKTRAKILEAAGRVFRRRGYHATGVDAVMGEAGLTPGGFYAHFGSKEDLLADALAQAADSVDARRDRALDGLSGRAWAEAFVAYYLSPSHRLADEDGCPLAALISEVAHAGEPVKRSFEAVVLRLAARLADEDPPADDRAFAILALCVGGLGLARSVRDEALAGRVLDACRTLAGTLLADDPPPGGPAGG